jgi:hypothetical protein
VQRKNRKVIIESVHPPSMSECPAAELEHVVQGRERGLLESKVMGVASALAPLFATFIPRFVTIRSLRPHGRK